MKIAFYKGTGHLFDRLTRFWTQGTFSHCELVFDNGISASSSFRDKGVRFKDIDYTIHPERWVVIDLAYLGIDTQEKAFDWFEERQNCKYDVLGLAGFLLRFIPGQKNKYFCSEAIAEALGFKEAWRFCPNSLYVIMLQGAAHASK